MLTFGMQEVRPAALASLRAFADAVDSLSDYELLGPTRCHGWAPVDLIAHVNAGFVEMFVAAVRRTEKPVTRDAASYWSDFPPGPGDTPEDLMRIMSTRRRGSVTTHPSAVREQFHDYLGGVKAMLLALEDSRLDSQGQVITAGDFMAIWTVELVIHHLDLMPAAGPQGLPPCAAGGLDLTRRTIEALAGRALPWDDVTVALVGAGRSAAPDGGAEGATLPVLG